MAVSRNHWTADAGVGNSVCPEYAHPLVSNPNLPNINLLDCPWPVCHIFLLCNSSMLTYISLQLAE